MLHYVFGVFAAIAAFLFAVGSARAAKAGLGRNTSGTMAILTLIFGAVAFFLL